MIAVVFAESVVEEAAFPWLEDFGYAEQFGPDIALGEPTAERFNLQESRAETASCIIWEAMQANLIKIRRVPQSAVHDTFLTGHECLFRSNQFRVAARDQVFVLEEFFI